MWQKLFKPIDIAPLIFFRVFGGGLMTIEIAGELLTSYHQEFFNTEVHFSYYFFQWLEPWPEIGVTIHMSFNILMALCVTLGLFYRWTTILMFLGTTSMFLMEKSVYINHTYLYCLLAFLLIFMPANRAWSLDVKRDPSIASSTTPAWTVYLLLFQISVVYFFAGIAKMNPDWLHAQPMTLWLSPRRYDRFFSLLDKSVLGPYLFYIKIGFHLLIGLGLWKKKTRLFALVLLGIFYYIKALHFVLGTSVWPYVVCYGGVFFDTLIVPALLWKKTRKYAFVSACLFHFINVCTFGIGTFPWLSGVMSALFFAPESFRKLKFLNNKIPKFNPATYQLPSLFKRKWQFGLIITYVVIQLAVPTRQWLYPGNTSWTENGHNFSWHMMLRSKRGRIMFTVKDPKSQQEWKEDPYNRVTAKQVSRLKGKPDMIIEYAHYLADTYREMGYPEAEVYANAQIQLNARKKQALVDTTVNLAKEKWSLLPYDWVIPLKDGPIIYGKK